MCGDNIISTDYARTAQLDQWKVPKSQAKWFQGVGGVSHCVNKGAIPLDELSETAEFWVSGQSPALSSLGYRCMEQGLSFVWPAYEDPYFVTPWGTAVPLTVDGYIPYLVPGSSANAPKLLEGM